MQPRYEVLAHTADTGVVAHGGNPSEAFVNAAFAMFDLMFGIAGRTGTERVTVEVGASNREELLVGWLSDLLFEAEAADLAFCEFGIEDLEEQRLTGWARGIPSSDLELAGPPIKAVTYHGLRVEQVVDGWQARVVFDV